MTNRLAPDELLVEIQRARAGRADGLPQVRPQAREHAGRGDRGRRTSRGAASRVADARIALGAAGPHPIRARAAERLLVGSSLGPDAIAAAAAAAARESEPFTDGIATEWYRRRMIGLFVGRALEQLAHRAESEGR